MSTAASPVLRRTRRVLEVALTVITSTAGVVSLWSVSYPSGDFGWTLTAMFSAILGLVVFTGLTVVSAVSRRFSVGLLVPVIAATVTLVAVRFDLPLQARFAQAQPGFERAILDRGEAGPSAPCPDRIGSYRVFGCYTAGSDTFFATPGGFLDTVGFAYLPEGVPATSDDRLITFEHLNGPWYTYVEAW